MRLEQLDECIQILKAMWTQEVPGFKGKHFEVREAYNNPRSIQTTSRKRCTTGFAVTDSFIE